VHKIRECMCEVLESESSEAEARHLPAPSTGLTRFLPCLALPLETVCDSSI